MVAKCRAMCSMRKKYSPEGVAAGIVKRTREWSVGVRVVISEGKIPKLGYVQLVPLSRSRSYTGPCSNILN